MTDKCYHPHCEDPPIAVAPWPSAETNILVPLCYKHSKQADKEIDRD